MPTGITLDTWGTYWQWYSNDIVQRKRLQMSAVLAGILVYLVPLLVISSLRSTQRSLHGDARFALTSEVRKAGLFAHKGVIVGKYKGQYLMFDSKEFVLLAAPTQSGKGVAIVIPNLLNYAGSIVVLDIKLENFKITSGFRAAHGQKVFLFNPFAENGQTHRWNALDGIRRNLNYRIGDILAIAQAMYPSDVDEKNKIWNDLARNLFLAITLYLLETPELPCTLGEVLRQSSGKGKDLKKHLQDLVAERESSGNSLSNECQDAIGRFCSTSENTLTSILASFNAPLTIFASPIVDAATSASDIDVTMVRKQLMTIYIGIPPNRLADASLLINLFFYQLINENTKELPANDPKLKYQCLLIPDEFTAAGKIGIIAKSVSYMAGYNLRLMPIIQNVSQLESVYGKNDAATFIINHAMQIVYPPQDQTSANAYSEMLGFFTEKGVSTGTNQPRAWGSNHATTSENVSPQRRALLMPQELKELGREEQIIFLRNVKPIICHKARYYEDPMFIDRLKSISPALAALGKKLPTQAQLEQAAFVLNELSAVIPILDVDSYRTNRTGVLRALTTSAPVDLSKLSLDITSLPSFDNPVNPSKESVTNLVNAFFSQLEWVDESTGEVSEARETPPDNASQTIPSATRKTTSSPRMIDLSLLET